MQSTQTRRSFLTTLSSAGVVGLVRARDSYAQEAPPETTTVRLGKIYGICIAPQYVAEDLLRAEGFTDVRYVATNPGMSTALALAHGEIDFTTNYAPPMAISIDAGEPITIVGGEHVGCFEVFAREGIRSIADLRGTNVGVQNIGSSQHIFLSVIAAHVGLDPAKDIHWVTSTSPKPMELFADGKIDAFLGLPPEPQELRGRNIGRVIVNSILDRPWSQYFCCVLAANREYIRKYPIACCAPLSKPPISAQASRRALRGRSSMPGSLPATIMRCRRSRKFRTCAGGNTIPRMRSASTRCGCAKQV